MSPLFAFYFSALGRVDEALAESRKAQQLDPLPASTGIQAILCRPELLIDFAGLPKGS